MNSNDKLEILIAKTAPIGVTTAILPPIYYAIMTIFAYVVLNRRFLAVLDGCIGL